jgi:U3 small nucleolar RNA-associated protein 14
MFDLSQIISALKLKNGELVAEKELARDRTGVSSRTSESKSDGDKSDSESDTQDRDRDREDHLREFRNTISTLNTQMTNLAEPSTPIEDLKFKLPGATSETKLSNGLTNGQGLSTGVQ